MTSQLQRFTLEASCNHAIDDDRSRGSYQMLGEQSVTRRWKQSMVPSTPTFLGCLFRQRMESSADGFLVLIFIPILRSSVRYVFHLYLKT